MQRSRQTWFALSRQHRSPSLPAGREHIESSEPEDPQAKASSKKYLCLCCGLMNLRLETMFHRQCELDQILTPLMLSSDFFVGDNWATRHLKVIDEPFAKLLSVPQLARIGMALDQSHGRLDYLQVAPTPTLWPLIIQHLPGMGRLRTLDLSFRAITTAHMQEVTEIIRSKSRASLHFTSFPDLIKANSFSLALFWKKYSSKGLPSNFWIRD